jgi:hypothetical protein
LKTSIREKNIKANTLAEIISYYKSHNQSRYTFEGIDYTHKPYDWNNRKNRDLISFYLYYPEEDCYNNFFNN